MMKIEVLNIIVYIYLIKAGRSFYTGITKKPEQRLKDHINKQGSKFLKYHNFDKEMHIIGTENSLGNALRTEKRIKKLSRKEKKDLYINSTLIIKI